MVDAPTLFWRHRLHEIVFEADTSAGKAFDVALIFAIAASVTVVMLESVAALRQEFSWQLAIAEWFFTVLFTVEYGARMLSVSRPLRYAKSFFGIIDLLAILPTYLSLIITGTNSLLVIRVFRLFRIFRVFKLRHYLTEVHVFENALRNSRPKITVFLVTVISIALVMGTVMYLVEGGASGFTSIPRSVYWAVVTMTTVGYGNIAPVTPFGQFAAGCLMILGYAIIAVPTGIMSVEIAQQMKGPAVSTQACLECAAEGHDVDAMCCKFCGASLELE